MRTSTPSWVLAATLATTLLVGCGGSGGGDDNGTTPPPGPPPLPGQVATSNEFIQYVLQVIAQFTNDAEALDVDALNAPTTETDEPAEV